MMPEANLLRPLLSPDHVYLNACDEITKISAPLMKAFHVNAFTFAKFYWSGSAVTLTTHKEWAKYNNENCLYQFLHDSPDFRLRKYLFDDEADKNTDYWKYVLNPAAKLFDLCHGIMLIERHLGHLIFYYYTTPNDNTLFDRNFLLYLDKFKEFNYYFKNAAKSYIDQAEQQRYKIPTLKHHRIFVQDSFVSDDALSEFDVAIQNSRHFILNDNQYLTTREFECTKLLVMNYSAKQIAKKMNVSTHTVYEYIGYLKKKLQVKNKKQLVEKLQTLSDMVPAFSPSDKDVIVNFENDYIELVKTINIEGNHNDK